MAWGELHTPAPPKARPCEYCPVWEFLHDPATREGERAIRADERRSRERLIEALHADVRRGNDRIASLEAEVRKLRAQGPRRHVR